MVSTVLAQHLESLNLPPDLWSPTDKVGVPELFKLIKTTLNSIIRVQRRQAISLTAAELVIAGFPPDIVEEKAIELGADIEEYLSTAIQGQPLATMLKYIDAP